MGKADPWGDAAEEAIVLLKLVLVSMVFGFCVVITTMLYFAVCIYLQPFMCLGLCNFQASKHYLNVLPTRLMVLKRSDTINGVINSISLD